MRKVIQDDATEGLGHVGDLFRLRIREGFSKVVILELRPQK